MVLIQFTELLSLFTKKVPHSIELSGKSLKPVAGQDLEIEEPIRRRYLPSLDFNGTLPTVYCASLVRNQVRQDRKTVEKDPLAASFMMKPFHHKELAVHRIVKLIYWGGRFGNVGVLK